MLNLLLRLIEECKSLLPILPSDFIFHQGGTPAHMAKLAQDLLPPTTVNLLAKMNGHQLTRWPGVVWIPA